MYFQGDGVDDHCALPSDTSTESRASIVEGVVYNIAELIRKTGGAPGPIGD